MAEKGSQYTQHELDLLNRKILPADNTELRFIDDNASAILPEESDGAKKSVKRFEQEAPLVGSLHPVNKGPSDQEEKLARRWVRTHRGRKDLD